MSGETILVTRAKGDEKSLTDALHAEGYRVIHEPLTEIFLHHNKRQLLHHALLSEPDAIIATSRHGVHALALLSDMRDIYILCVGEATAQAAESLGFTRVGVAGGDVQSLIDTIEQCYDEGSRFLYASGEHVRADLQTVLANMHIERVVLYEAIAAEKLSDTLAEQLRRGQIDAVTFFSRRAAELFITLLESAEATANLHAFCVSDAVAEALNARAWKDVRVAREATLASVVECIDNAFGSEPHD